MEYLSIGTLFTVAFLAVIGGAIFGIAATGAGMYFFKKYNTFLTSKGIESPVSDEQCTVISGENKTDAKDALPERRSVCLIDEKNKIGIDINLFHFYAKKTPTEELYIANNNELSAKPLFNGIESCVFGAIKQVINEINEEYKEYTGLKKIDKYHVLGQVSIGELLSYPQNKSAVSIAQYWTFAKKRIDFVIIEEVMKDECPNIREYNCILAIEVNGSGHFQNKDQPLKDEAKRIILEQFGIPLLTIDTREEEGMFSGVLDKAKLKARNRKIFNLVLGKLRTCLYDMGKTKHQWW